MENVPKTSRGSQFHRKDTVLNTSRVSHCNYPAIAVTYKDLENGHDKVVMMVSLPGGAKNVRIHLDDSGSFAVIKYCWSETMYDMEKLFENHLAANQFNANHPLVLCIKNVLEKVRERSDTAPEAFNRVRLPVKVDTSKDSWTTEEVKHEDGTQIMIADFTV